MTDLNVAGIQPLNRFLKIAVLAGVARAIQIHIDRGDDLNARDSSGMTPLMLSAARNNSIICKLLLDAGADKSLLDPSGRTALAIAIAAGAHESAEILSAITTSVLEVGALPNVNNQALESNEYSKNEIVQWAVQTEQKSISDFDLTGWEPEGECIPPEDDLTVLKVASDIQFAITEYEPIDSSVNWDDIDAYLPEQSLPLARTDDIEARERLHLLLLRAIREGSVPSFEIDALSLNSDQTPNTEAKALLTMVIHDLGAEYDERFEYASVDENFEVFIKPEVTSAEEEAISEALFFIDNLTSRRNDPLRIYQKELQVQRLISANEEVLLGQAMDAGLELAIDSLASWPEGLLRTLAAGRLVQAGNRPLTWFSLGFTEAQQNLGSVFENESHESTEIIDQDDVFDSNDDSPATTYSPSNEHISYLISQLDSLEELTTSSITIEVNRHLIREILASLRLSRRFLLELSQTEESGSALSATQYSAAIKRYQSARDRMAAANLKLVFHLAKKYLYSGEPLDDLVQSGNIGLLKAIDRYDWRRGFKFSTYATWWIRQHIGRHIADNCRMIRIPVYVYQKLQRFNRETQMFELEFGRAPSMDEIAMRLEISAQQASEFLRLAYEPLTIDELSIDELIAVDVRSDFISPDPLDVICKFELKKAINKAMAQLQPKDEQILRLRFGIGVPDSLTLEEVGQRYMVTRERIRQIEANAIEKLKHPTRIDVLSNAVFGIQLSKENNEKNNKLVTEKDKNSVENDQGKKLESIELNSEKLDILRPTRSLSVDRLLKQAEGLGIPTNDDRSGPSGKIWIECIETSETRHRKLIRKLLAFGFELWPGKGYCK